MTKPNKEAKEKETANTKPRDVATPPRAWTRPHQNSKTLSLSSLSSSPVHTSPRSTTHATASSHSHSTHQTQSHTQTSQQSQPVKPQPTSQPAQPTPSSQPSPQPSQPSPPRPLTAPPEPDPKTQPEQVTAHLQEPHAAPPNEAVASVAASATVRRSSGELNAVILALLYPPLIFYPPLSSS